MRKPPLPVALLLMLLAAAGAVADPAAETGPPAIARGFPDFGHMISPDQFAAQYPDTPVFELKTDFPAEPPEELPAFLDIDFREDWEGYILGVRDECFEGNLPAWNPHGNEVRGWYHIPWLHPTSATGYPPHGGTEGFHGLIKEAEVDPYQLAATQAGSYQVYAITLINGFAATTMERMWRDPLRPDPGATDRRWGGGFPVGAVFCKLLFTDAPTGDDVVPFLENPLEWQAYITESWDSPTRAVLPVHLLQMDIMVRDARAEQWMGWVFGTFAYNGQLGNEENRFMNLVPVGLQWGNDPGVTENIASPLPPKETKPNPALEQTVINPSPDLPPQHLGWGGRLNGPADLTTSACMSCHSTAEFPALTSLVAPGAVPQTPVPPNGGSPAWMEWFRNVPAATPIDEQAYSTDMSLQVVIALQNFRDTMNADLGGFWAEEFRTPEVTVSRGGGE